VKKRRWVVNNEDIPIATSKQKALWDRIQKKIEYRTAGFQNCRWYYSKMDYNNFQYKMRYTAKSRISKIAKRFSTWVSYTYSVNDYEFDSFTPSITLTLGILPRSDSIMISRQPENFSGRIWRNVYSY
jgi:hypothetical protein